MNALTLYLVKNNDKIYFLIGLKTWYMVIFWIDMLNRLNLFLQNSIQYIQG